jgi:hypothetical protein
VPARSRAPAKLDKGSDDSAHEGALRQARRGECCARGRRPIAEFRNERPATGLPARAQLSNLLLDDETMPVICPTGQAFFKSGLSAVAGLMAAIANRD